MENKSSFKMREYSPRVVRRDYTKVQNNFVPPNLPSLQVNAYKKFLNEELGNIISSFFPIHSPNGKFSVEYNGLAFADPELSEKQARIESKTYDASLYVDLSLINHETGSVKKAKKSAKTSRISQDGIFFAKVPIMTDKGAFLVNGIEKFVIAQIARSPGAYILSKSQVKLSNSRKRNQEGYVCEILPAKGTLMLVYIAENKDFVQAVIRDVTGESAKVFSITTLLKAFGLSEREILRVFNNNDYISRTLTTENYNRKYIFRDTEIMMLLKELAKEKEETKSGRGLAIDFYLKDLVAEYYVKNKAFEEYLEKNKINPNKLPEKLPKDYEKYRDELDTLIEKIICEKAAKHVVHELSISTKTLDVSYDPNLVPTYQLLMWQHFFQKRRYELSLPGRYKFVRKLRVSERLYQRTLAQDLKDNQGNVVLAKGTLILKPEIDKIKRLTKEKKLNVIRNISFINNSINSGRLEQQTNYETVLVYTNNESRDLVTPIIGIDGSNDSIDTLTMIDLLSIISYIINLPHGIGNYDDIDHLGNKRLKLINELLHSRIHTGMTRMERYIREKLAIADGSNKNVEVNDETGELVESEKQKARLTIKSVVNSKPFQLVIKDFFNTHQLTQFLDQQNPLSELTNKRRISAMGPGGISREDPNLDIRDVHYSHYGRICPIETPEGMNIGLIMSLAFYATIDSNGFLMSPYRRVVDGKITDNVEYLTALREDEYIIAESSATMKVNSDGKIDEKQVIARYRSSQELYDPKRIDYIDVAPRQVVSIAAGLIPFLENDDSARALMGANMQRQATPLLKPYAPIVGTGVEYKIAHDSGMAVLSRVSGKVTSVDGNQIVIKSDDNKLHTHNLVKFEKSNQNTSYNQMPIVRLNETVAADQVIADGPSMKNGELALGQNVLVAFTTWRGYNYEDAIVISDRLFRDDVYTSININEYTVQCVRTRNGDEEITRDIPNVSEEAKRYLDEDGVIMVGAEVKEGDILVGKISPKGQVDLSAEEKLLQAIFGEKTKNIRESSLKVPNGGEGTVAAVRRFSIAKGDELDDDVIELVKVFIVQKRKIQIGDKVAGRHGNKGIISKIVPVEDMPHLEDGTPIDIMLNPLGVPSRMNIGQIFEAHLGLAARELAKKELIEGTFANNGDKYLSDLFGLELSIAKSVVSVFKAHLKERKITNIEEARQKVKTIDIDILLRQMGLHYDDLAYKISTPVFEGVNMSDLKDIMKEAGMDAVKNRGKFKLIDGRTGEPFEKPITVGVMYMLKLDHMVDDKIHSRAVGPYSKITQQPLGGKSQNGGQRFGEMEVWALQAYGAAHNLRELLTIKSDDVRGRNLTYNAIIKGREIPTPGIPESFKLLTKELQGLGLAVNIIYDDNSKDDINSYTVVHDTDDEDEIDESLNRTMTESFSLDDEDDKY